MIDSIVQWTNRNLSHDTIAYRLAVGIPVFIIYLKIYLDFLSAYTTGHLGTLVFIPFGIRFSDFAGQTLLVSMIACTGYFVVRLFFGNLSKGYRFLRGERLYSKNTEPETEDIGSS